MSKFLLGVTSCCMLFGLSLQANQPTGYYHPNASGNQQPHVQQTPTLCPCGCGCVAPCYCGCMEGKPCRCNHR